MRLIDFLESPLADQLALYRRQQRFLPEVKRRFPEGRPPFLIAVPHPGRNTNLLLFPILATGERIVDDALPIAKAASPVSCEGSARRDE